MQGTPDARKVPCCFCVVVRDASEQLPNACNLCRMQKMACWRSGWSMIHGRHQPCKAELQLGQQDHTRGRTTGKFHHVDGLKSPFPPPMSCWPFHVVLEALLWMEEILHRFYHVDFLQPRTPFLTLALKASRSKFVPMTEILHRRRQNSCQC